MLHAVYSPARDKLRCGCDTDVGIDSVAACPHGPAKQSAVAAFL